MSMENNKWNYKYILTSVIALSLLATMPAWGQTNVIKRIPAQQPAKVKTGPQWKWKGKYSEGLAAVEDNGGKRGYIDQSGKLVIPCKWKYSWLGGPYFEDGLALVQDDKNNYGYINKTGTIVIPCKWESAYSFFEGKARVKGNNNQWHIINKQGEIVK